MSADEFTKWVGASKTEYEFFIFDLDTNVPARSGIYIYSKKNPDNAWIAIYMGMGDLSARCRDPDLLGCIHAKKATHVHLRLMTREEDRQDETRDILAHQPAIFAPEGCQPETDRPPPQAPADVIPPEPPSAS